MKPLDTLNKIKNKELQMTTYTVELKEDDSGDLFMPIPEEILEQLGWEVGDVIDFQLEGEGFRIQNLTR